MGLYHCWNRYYDPAMGRWITPDPVATPWWNLWDYADEYPIARTDGSGLFSLKRFKDMSDWYLLYYLLRKKGVVFPTDRIPDIGILKILLESLRQHEKSVPGGPGSGGKLTEEMIGVLVPPDAPKQATWPKNIPTEWHPPGYPGEPPHRPIDDTKPDPVQVTCGAERRVEGTVFRKKGAGGYRQTYTEFYESAQKKWASELQLENNSTTEWCQLEGVDEDLKTITDPESFEKNLHGLQLACYKCTGDCRAGEKCVRLTSAKGDKYCDCIK